MNSQLLAPAAKTKKTTRKTKSKSSLSPLETKMLQWLKIVYSECETLIGSSIPVSDGNHFNHAAFGAWRIRTKLCLREVLGVEHEYYKDFCSFVDDDFLDTVYICRKSAYVLKAIREDIEAGYLRGYKGLIQAELFSDFLDSAEHLLEQGYKDAAAVITGSVLEDHLKKLCTKHSISLEVQKANGDMRPRKAGELNDELAREKVYALPLKQAVVGWLTIRNSAAHGEYDEYNAEQVRMLLLMVREFLQTHPL